MEGLHAHKHKVKARKADVNTKAQASDAPDPNPDPFMGSQLDESASYAAANLSEVLHEDRSNSTSAVPDNSYNYGDHDNEGTHGGVDGGDASSITQYRNAFHDATYDTNSPSNLNVDSSYDYTEALQHADEDVLLLDPNDIHLSLVDPDETIDDETLDDETVSDETNTSETKSYDFDKRFYVDPTPAVPLLSTRKLPPLPTTFPMAPPPTVPIRLPDQKEVFARLDRERAESRKKRGYHVDEQGNVIGEDGGVVGDPALVVDRDNMVGKGRPGSGVYFLPFQGAKELNLLGEGDTVMGGERGGMGGFGPVGSGGVYTRGMKGGAGDWVAYEGEVGVGEEVYMGGGGEPEDEGGKLARELEQAKRLQEYMEERLPYVHASSSRLQAVLGTRNDMVFVLPQSLQQNDLPRLPDGGLDRSKLPPGVRGLYATPPGTSISTSDLNSIPSSPTDGAPDAMHNLLKQALTASARSAQGAQGAPFAAWKLPPTLRSLYTGPESLDVPGTSTSSKGPKTGGKGGRSGLRPPNIIVPPSSTYIHATQNSPSAFSSTEYIPPRGSFGKNNKKLESPLSPVFDVSVDPETGKGLREWLLAKGKELGFRKRECTSISFHDLAPDMRTNSFRNKVLGYYGSGGLGQRIDVYEIDLPATTIRPGTNNPISSTETWIWFLISRPVIAINPTAASAKITDPLLNPGYSRCTQSSSSSSTEETYAPSSRFSTTSSVDAPATVMPPPNFPSPVPTSWVVFACPLANVTVHKEIIENISNAKGPQMGTAADAAEALKSKRGSRLGNFPLVREDRAGVEARPMSMMSQGPGLRPHEMRPGVGGMGMSASSSSSSSAASSDQPMTGYSQGTGNVGGSGNDLGDICGGRRGRVISKRTDIDLSHQGIPIFEFSTLAAPYLNNRITSSARPFLSVDGIGPWHAHDKFEAYPDPEYMKIFLSWRQWLKDQSDTSEGDGLAVGGKGRERNMEVPSVFMGTWWGVFVQAMFDDVWKWEHIKGAMGRGKCRVVVRWKDWEEESAAQEMNDRDSEMEEPSLGLGLGLDDLQDLKKGLMGMGDGAKDVYSSSGSSAGDARVTKGGKKGKGKGKGKGRKK